MAGLERAWRVPRAGLGRRPGSALITAVPIVLLITLLAGTALCHHLSQSPAWVTNRAEHLGCDNERHRDASSAVPALSQANLGMGAGCSLLSGSCL